MFENALQQNSYLIVALSALIVNIPLGYIRESSPKFSVQWLFWIHASIPLIIYVRISLGTSKWFIPVCIFLAVVGQIWGGRWRRKKMSVKDKEALAQIPQLDGNATMNIPDMDVMVALPSN